MTLIFDQLAEEFASQKDTTLVLTDFTTTRYAEDEAGAIVEVSETAVSLTWKEEDSPWSNFIVTKKRRSPASVTETYSGVASVPESPLLRRHITSETKLLETSTSSPPQRNEIVWTGTVNLPNAVLVGWLARLSQGSSLSIHGRTSGSTETFRVPSLFSTSNESSDQVAGLDSLSKFLNKIIGSYFQQHQETLGLIIFPSSSPMDSIVLVPSSSKSTSSTSPTSSSPRSEDSETSEDLSDSDDKS